AYGRAAGACRRRRPKRSRCRKLSDAYGLWRACLSVGCRRAGRCQGDLDCACLAEQRDRVDFDG
ncbi:hypothetical protein ACIKT0_14345, partial [Hansschlegelia beijingensis]